MEPLASRIRPKNLAKFIALVNYADSSKMGLYVESCKLIIWI